MAHPPAVEPLDVSQRSLRGNGDQVSAENLTVIEHLVAARRYAAQGDEVFADVGYKVDAAALDRAGTFYSAANAHATAAIAMLEAGVSVVA
jgi:hypothetical protein